jgi:hypothetical protein
MQSPESGNRHLSPSGRKKGGSGRRRRQKIRARAEKESEKKAKCADSYPPLEGAGGGKKDLRFNFLCHPELKRGVVNEGEGSAGVRAKL